MRSFAPREDADVYTNSDIASAIAGVLASGDFNLQAAEDLVGAATGEFTYTGRLQVDAVTDSGFYTPFYSYTVPAVKVKRLGWRKLHEAEAKLTATPSTRKGWEP